MGHEVQMNKRQKNRFRSLLNERLAVLVDVSVETASGMTHERAVHADPTDRASHETDRNFTLRLRDRDRKLIAKIEDALQRLDEGTFGTCTECGEDISEARLKARPVTTLCIACKEEAERSEVRRRL